MSIQTKVRLDAWDHKDDVLLKETVLKHIKEGSTQLIAFDEAGDKLKRTAAACAYRWNAILREKHTKEFQQAKIERLNKKKSVNAVVFLEKPTEIVRSKVEIKDLEIKEYNGQRVVTFKDIDELHGRIEGTARKRFNDNKERFIEGVDYFSINSSVRKTDNKNNRIYITQSGYLMIVKSFTDDLSWDIQRKLVNSYFSFKNIAYKQLPTTFAEALRLAANLEEEKQKLESEKLILEQRVSEYEPKVTYVDTILQSKDCLLVRQIAEDYGLTAQELNKILHDKGIQYKMNKQWLLYSQYKGLGYTKSDTVTYTKSNGEKGTSLHTKWTQKGRLFIHNILEGLGISALMDKENPDAPTSEL